MGIMLSLLLIAAGAILRWAVSADASGVNLHVVGLILLVVGLAGLVASILAWAAWGWGWGWGRRDAPPPDDRY